MNKIKKEFSISDLENLSGIKAHTIRIWEKRYNLLSPERTHTNIRKYSVESLQKLLNISMLYQNGYKISKIATIPEKKLSVTVQQVLIDKKDKDQILNTFKIAMINFDQELFLNTYNTLLKENSFSDIVIKYFIPLLHKIGLLWQTGTIKPIHERFIFELIRQKLVMFTDKLSNKKPIKTDKVFITYLPDNELHELGILFITHEILLKGYRCIYLGQSIPLENLKELLKHHNNLHFISYFTVEPSKDKLLTYFEEFVQHIANEQHSPLWVLGRQLHKVDQQNVPKHITMFSSIEQLIDKL